MSNSQAKAAAEDPSCPVCSSEGGCKVRHKKHGYLIYRCSECKVLFVHPQPSPAEVMTQYGPDYFRRGDKYSFEEENPARNPNWQNDLIKLSILAQYKPSGRLLDIGCAMGGFLRVARERGYDVSGVEPSEHTVSHVRNKLGIEVVNSSLPEAGLSSESYDLVTMWDVLEHLGDPHPTLQEIHRILRPSGLLVLSTGDASSLWARITGRFWQLLTPPQHLFFYDDMSLRKALQLNSFAVKKILYLGKRTTLDFILFKARETFGPIASPARAILSCLGLNKAQVSVNLYDIMTCISEKR